MGEEQGTPEAGPSENTGTSSGTTTRGLTPAMRTVLWVVAGTVLLGIAVAVWLLVTAPGSGAAPDPESGATSGATPTHGAIPGATPTTGSEVQPPDSAATPSDRLPPLPESSPLVSDPLPASGSASGELVTGFPADLMGPAPDSQVLESSIATEGSTMQVTLVARTDAAADDVREHYRALWAGLGLIATAGEEGTVAYSDSFSSLSLAFSPSSGTGTVYMIFGVFRTS